MLCDKLKFMALFSLDELDERICGKRDLDVKLFKSITKYVRCTAEDEYI